MTRRTHNHCAKYPICNIMFQVTKTNLVEESIHWAPRLHLFSELPISARVPLLCQLLLCGLTVVGFGVRQGCLATGLLLSWAEGPGPFSSSRASLAGGGRGSTTGSLPSGFLAPLHRASICGLTLIRRHRCLKKMKHCTRYLNKKITHLTCVTTVLGGQQWVYGEPYYIEILHVLQ